MIAADKKRGSIAMYNLRDSGCQTWSSRADAAAQLWLGAAAAGNGTVPDVWRIADIGCGDEKLRGPLSRSGLQFQYTGFDKIPQSPAVRPLDLVRDSPTGAYDIVFCLGVLEYLADVPKLLAKLRAISPRVVVSYVVADAGDYTPDQVADRSWLHHFTAAELESMFAHVGFSVVASTRIDAGRTAVWLLEANDSAAGIGEYAMLTPFPIPAELNGAKVPNLGDGFIERAIFEQLAPHRCSASYSTRVPLTDEAIERINATRLLVVAGANQLNDSYTIVPGMTPEIFSRLRVPVVPLGVGIHGIASFNEQMSAPTRTLLRMAHERTRYSSWRCPRSIAYLDRHCPELRGQALMTGCPVIYSDDLLHGTPFTATTEQIVVTVTERHDFWRRESRTIDFVSRQFPQAEKTLSLHQVYPRATDDGQPVSWWKRVTNRGPKTQSRLSEYARARGFKVVAPTSVDEGQRLYNDCDLHIGSRLHAHLYFLSRAKRSFLSYVDDRSSGMAEATDFPICDPAHWRRHLDFDFEQYRRGARRCHQAMARINWTLKEIMS